MFWVRSDLDSGKNFISGGVLDKVGLGLWEEFHFWGGVGEEGFWNQIPEQGCSGEFGQKFLET